MAEFKISRLRYTWKGVWNTSTSYNKDDVVRYGGAVWTCIRQHTSSLFNSDLTFVSSGETSPSPAWLKMLDGFSWKDNWQTSELYEPGDIVNYGGNLWLCTVSHTSQTTFDESISNWTVYATGQDWNNIWQENTRYGINDIVRYNGIVYICTEGHTSSTTSLGLEADSSKWAIYYHGVQYVGIWAEGVRYRENDLVKYGGSILRVNTGHTSQSSINSDYFTTEFPGHKFYNEWSDESFYAIGDVVKHGGYIYQSLRNNFLSNPSDSIYQGSSNPDWAVLSKAINLVGDWTSSETYKTGDVVRRGGALYVALLDTTDDGSSLDYLDAGNWELVVPGEAWKQSWLASTLYAVGDVVIFRGSAYRCIVEHLASNENFPGDNGEGFNFWDLLLSSGGNTGLTNRGDLLTYNYSRSLTGDGSTIDETNVPLGEQSKLLTIDNDSNLIYDDWGSIQRLFYVNSYSGVDDEDDINAGLDPNKPFKTIRFACEKADDRFDGHTTIQIATGIYEEILPIIVPAKTVLIGDEKRSVTVKPNAAITNLALDSTYTIAVLNHLKGVMRTLIVDETVTPTVGNTELQVRVNDGTLVGVTPLGEEIFSDIPIFSDAATADVIDGLVDNIVAYINFFINSTGSSPSITGTNTLTSTQARINSARVLIANKAFLGAEAVAFMQLTYPSYVFQSDLCKRDVRRYIDAFDYDLRYPGNYKSIYAAKYYKNAVLGSKFDDMFYVRDATGIRNMTLTDLDGTLNPPNVFELYQRPTGGSYVSLDPGWGPADDRTWITTRSCYVQNVATFGNRCTGQKIDGSLHNGGNKSIVSNDFTQVISDGVGAHVLNNGRAELVSVFSYYSQIGYLATNGGIIRATNGNNSYGAIGCLADGNDESETPLTATVNNRLENAQIASAFAGEVNDEILTLEYLNAGQNYTSANYTFVGAGVSASVVQDEFRDDAVFNARIINGPSGENAGGGGFTLVGNNAQSGNTTTITLATSDDNEEGNYLGLRIIITSGTGTGQYGYVQAYNSTSKVLTVYRESDDQPGWDHVTPGWPIATLLDTSTTYRFEPRPTFNAPPYSATDISLDAGTTWANITYGETSATYTGIEGSIGTGTVVTDDGLVATSATWTVIREGRDYSVTLVNPGAGYAQDQTVTISGDDLGGISPDNDITITVTEISDDSTNSIISFIYTGYATSGLFVATASTGTTTNYSLDGENWSTGNLSVSGNWAGLAAGDYRFVTVQRDSNFSAYSLDGANWVTRALPSSKLWNAVAYGKPSDLETDTGIFVAVAEDDNAGAFSITRGNSWISTTLPTIGDSTVNEWVDIAYGKNKFVVVAKSNNIAADGVYNPTTNTITWTPHIMDVIDDSSQKDWTSVAYGNNRFVAISSQGDVAYSFDGAVWYPATMPSADGSTVMNWNKIRYGQGVFFAVCDTGGRDIGDDPTTGPTTYAATSYDGIVWTGVTLSEELTWKNLAFGNPDVTTDDGGDNRKGTWIILPEEITTSGCKVHTGARTLGRCIVEGGRIAQVRLWEPGSGYTSAPTLTVFDPNATTALFTQNRMADRVLAQPSWLGRGVGYQTSTTTVNIIGDGFADIIPTGKFVSVSNLNVIPGPGAQLRFADNETVYTVVAIERESEDNGSFTLRFRISPELTIDDALEHDTVATIRQRYSQIRITGHDFLDIGTGNFTETNYPELYSGPFFSQPENEVVEFNGGRVFYTSTDQSGNFRCGELFAVEQATGIVTISADFFDLGGLTELALGGVRLGGSGAVIREFSTDPLFTADSNNVIPTQRAIKAYLQNRLNVGGADLLTASFVAGTVRVGPDLIGSSAGLAVRIPVLAKFEGPQANIRGSMLAQSMFYRSFKNRNG